MRKDTTTAKITEYEVERNPARWSGGKEISKKRYIAAPCGIVRCIRAEYECNVIESIN